MQDRPPFVMHVVYNECCYVLRAGEGGKYMAQINVNNLTFAYEGSMTTENIMTQTANVVTLRTSYGRITITGWSFLIYLENRKETEYERKEKR